MSLQKVGEFISRVGFPIAVAGYLLFRMDWLLKDLTGAINKLSDLVGQLVIIGR